MNRTTTTTFVVFVVLASAIAAPTVAASTAASTIDDSTTDHPDVSMPPNNTTTAQEPTATTATTTQEATATTATTAQQPTTDDSTAEPCSVNESDKLLSQQRLYAPEKTIETGSPGQISGGFQVAPGTDCDIVVRITMQVPSGMQVSGSSDAISGGAGMVSSTFVVDDASGVKDVRAEVFGQNPGQRTVTADITYWPEGHEEMSKEIDGLAFTFDVESPSEDLPATNTPEESTTDEQENTQLSGLYGVPFHWAVAGGLMVLLLATIVLRR